MSRDRTSELPEARPLTEKEVKILKSDADLRKLNWYPAIAEAKIRGKIVSISSVLAATAHFETSSYHVSKAGVNALTRCLAVDLAKHKINVNAIGPGAIATEGLGSSFSPEVVEAYRDRIPWGARGRPRDIGHVVVFLASDEARYITGQTIYVDGGMLADSTPEGLRDKSQVVPPDDPDPV